jgi:hypothetical protein
MKEGRPEDEIPVLRGFDHAGREIVHEEMDLYDYWDGTHALIDSNEYRRSLGVVRLTGDVFGLDGLLQHFENHYGASGEYLRGRVEHADGTVMED